ncbi:MAG: hypothetical protein QM582_00470 [Micropruina sp.]|uniref:hypothetical protein n=1 Tax=Micropruina sp. TaxID=2737536 RepID=UPI0039E37F81
MLPTELTQRPLFAVTDARDCGVTPLDLQRALATRAVVRLKRGWYTAENLRYPADRHRLRVQAELRDHPETIPSHYSAAVLLGYPVHRPDWSRVHLMRTQPGPAQSRPTVVIHQRVGDVSVIDPSLVVAQTTLTCPTSGLMAADHALRADEIVLDHVERWSPTLANHAGHCHLPVVLRLANKLRESALESRTAISFDRWGWELEPQFEIPGTRYRADARLRGTRVLVECDGRGKYDEPGAQHREKVREDDIRALDWQVVRVTSELLDDRNTLFRRVKAAIARDTRH